MESSSLMSYMFLADVISALHCDATPNFSTTELNIKMPSSSYQFRTIYSLIHSHGPLPEDVRSREDSLLLLTALLNDIIYVQRSYPIDSLVSASHDGTTSSSKDVPLRNPYAPLSSVSERSRLNDALDTALDRWKEHFQQAAWRDIFTLYYFCKLQLTCPDICDLPSLAGYMTSRDSIPQSATSRRNGRRLEIPDEAMDLAWLVLDNCNFQSETFGRNLAIWLPVVLFQSALVIWQRLRFRSPTDIKHGTLKILGLFKNEIAQLPWACCLEMVITLDRLMKE
jgi:hypothetical protein